MKLKSRQCPNCGGTDILEKDGTYVCMNCRTFFDNENEFTINHNVTRVDRDETEIERIKSEERKEKEDNKYTLKLVIVILIAFAILGGIASIPHEKEIEVPEKASSYYQGTHKDKVINSLTDAGFTNVEAIPLNDLSSDESRRADYVDHVTVGGEDDWTTGIFLKRKKYKISTPVKVYYHSLKEDSP